MNEPAIPNADIGSVREAFNRELRPDLESLIADFWPVALSNEQVNDVVSRACARIMADLLHASDMARSSTSQGDQSA